MSNRPKFTAAILAFFLIICFTFSWLFSHVFSENARFENFAESIFEKEVSGNALNLHYSLAYPEKQGISRPRATLGTIHPNNEKASAQCQEYVKKLKKFSQSKLSTSNRLTLDLLLLYYHTEASLGDNYLLEEPLSPSLGIQAQLPVLLAEYSFYTNQDITDYLNLLCSTKEYFQSILAFEQTKSDAGFFMCDETLERIQDQCRAFIQNPDSNYMLEIFSQKLKAYGKLSEKDQEQLNLTHKQILKEKVLPAYQTLIEGLEQLRGTGKNTGGLVNFSGGKEYYQYLLKSQVGIYIPVEKLEKRLTQQLSTDSQEISELLKQHPQLLTLLNEKMDLPDMEPTRVMELLEKNIQQDFPSTASVDFEIRSVHKSMEEFSQPGVLPDTANGHRSAKCYLHQSWTANFQSGAFLPRWRTKASPVIFTRPFISDDKVHPISGISSITADTWKAGPLMWKVTRMIMQQIICLPAPYPHRKLLLARDFPG